MFKAELLKLRRRRVAVAVGACATSRSPRSPPSRVFLSATDAGAPGAASAGRPSSRSGRPAAPPRRSRSARRSPGSSCSSCSSRTSPASSRRARSARCSCASRGASALLAGKMAALLAFAAIVLARRRGPDRRRVGRDRADAGRLDGVVVQRSTASARPRATTRPRCSASPRGRALGMALAVFVRSIPVALAIGIVWSGPFEHLLEDAWTDREPVVPRPAARVARRRRHRRGLARAGARARRRLRRRGRQRRRARVRAPRRHGLSASRGWSRPGTAAGPEWIHPPPGLALTAAR